MITVLHFEDMNFWILVLHVFTGSGLSDDDNNKYNGLNEV